jgi:hypothetical protein
VFGYERMRGFYLTLVFPFFNVLVDIIVLRLIPPLIAALIFYPLVGLNPAPDRVQIFLNLFLLMCLTTALLSRFVVYMSLSVAPFQQAVFMSMQVIGLNCFMILYSGLLVSLSTFPSEKYFLRDFSVFYWVFIFHYLLIIRFFFVMCFVVFCAFIRIVANLCVFFLFYRVAMLFTSTKCAATYMTSRLLQLEAAPPTPPSPPSSTW